MQSELWIATTVGVCRGQYMIVDDGKHVYVLLCVCKFWKVFVGDFMCMYMLAGVCKSIYILAGVC